MFLQGNFLRHPFSHLFAMQTEFARIRLTRQGEAILEEERSLLLYRQWRRSEEEWDERRLAVSDAALLLLLS